MRQKDFVNPGKASFISHEMVDSLKEKSDELRANASPAQRELLEAGDQAFNKINDDLDAEASIQVRFRRAGYSVEDAEHILEFMRDKPIGLPVPCGYKIFVRTPYNTVVEAHVYIDTIQNKLIEFTSLSFVDLIKLAFKRLLGKG